MKSYTSRAYRRCKAALLALGLAALCLALPAQAATPLPRVIMVLYDGSAAPEGPRGTLAHGLAEMPLNHLGLIAEYHDIRGALPALATRQNVRGILTWFPPETRMPDPAAYTAWAEAAARRGIKLAVIGNPGIARLPDGTLTPPALMERFYSVLGLRNAGRWIEHTYDVKVTAINRAMFSAPMHVESFQKPSFALLRPGDPQTRIHLLLQKGDQSSALVTTGEQGGYVAEGYAFREMTGENEEIREWIIDPFAFFREAFATDSLPKPDTTTLAGRRIYYSHIDGDGWNSISRVEDYRRKPTLCAQVVLEKAILPYSDLPVTATVIAADIDPAWAGTPRSIEVAETMFRQEQVEAGSHTYTHPFYWQFFADGDWRREAPYLSLYSGGTWKGKEMPAPDTRNPIHAIAYQPATLPTASMDLPVGYKTPRAYALEPFSMEKEISGSAEKIAALLPPGKKVKLISWSGNTSPSSEALRLTREAGLANLNGGDTRADDEYPGYASVAPIGLSVGGERQIYASMSNENLYTSLWSGRFFGFKYLAETIDNTGSPRRLKPVNIYYHFYSAENAASLNALIQNLDYATKLPLAPVAASHFSEIAQGFYTTEILPFAEGKWQIKNRGKLPTIRFDGEDTQSVDFAASSGIVGMARYQGSLYVYLDETVESPIVALQKNTAANFPIPFLMESRWRVYDVKRDGESFGFSAQGFGKGEMAWRVPRSGRYRVTAAGHKPFTVSAPAGIARFAVNASAITPLSILVDYVASR